MQKLQFENSWNKTISKQDREQIEKTFLEVMLQEDIPIQFTVLWHAVNHSGDLLVTTLVHNTTTEMVRFDDATIQYSVNNNMVAEYSFSLPTLHIAPQTSMPWTFIFPTDSITKVNMTNKGTLVIVENS
ncbi:SLAP domain-containing protein [Aquibacillus sediminis]|uniref:SLAP domain-containing protein n=1 Tax=Aquibacillus sediminis TaxID=2574734 RepID=UPI001487245E|nr:SLAP domain-containing protein [Aquibacillus sediminis]